MTPIRKTILINLAEQLDHFLWTYSGEFGGDPWPNMPTPDACLYELSRRSLDIMLELLAEGERDRPRPQAVPPSPDQVSRSNMVANRRRRRRAERRNAERNEAERRRDQASWQSSKLDAAWPQVTEAETPAAVELDPEWFNPVEQLPATPTVTRRAKGGMP